MKTIQKQLREDLEYFGVSDASPESDEFELGLEEDCETEESIKEHLRKFSNRPPL